MLRFDIKWCFINEVIHPWISRVIQIRSVDIQTSMFHPYYGFLVYSEMPHVVFYSSTCIFILSVNQCYLAWYFIIRARMYTVNSTEIFSPLSITVANFKPLLPLHFLYLIYPTLPFTALQQWTDSWTENFKSRGGLIIVHWSKMEEHAKNSRDLHTLAGNDIGWSSSSAPRLTHKALFFKWTPGLVLALYPGPFTAISASASRSRTAALRGGALKRCPGESLATAELFLLLHNPECPSGT